MDTTNFTDDQIVDKVSREMVMSRGRVKQVLEDVGWFEMRDRERTAAAEGKPTKKKAATKKK